jgi:hypothetical protein
MLAKAPFTAACKSSVLLKKFSGRMIPTGFSSRSEQPKANIPKKNKVIYFLII